MALRIRASDEASVPAIRDFNARMGAAGSRWTFYDTPIPDWLAPVAGASAWREYFLAQDERDGAVRGGFVLKQQEFLVDGAPTLVGNVQGPVSEGIINKRFAPLGAVMLRDALNRQPLQFGWGTSAQKASLLTQLGWSSHQFPLLLKVVNKSAFARRNRIFSHKPHLQQAIRALSYVGLVQLGLAALQAALGFPRLSLSGVKVAEQTDFGPWADDIWRAVEGRYRLIARRDAGALTCVMPAGQWPDTIPMTVERDGKIVGWAAVRDRRLNEDPTFGDLRMGSVVDALSLPGFEAMTAAAVARRLQDRGVDAIGAVFSHPSWEAAFRRAGFIPLPGRRHFALSPALNDAGGGLKALIGGAHLSLIDGDGPRTF